MNSIKFMREALKITQVQLAKLLKVRQSTVAMWENGKNKPRADKLPQLAKVLQCSIDDLFAN